MPGRHLLLPAGGAAGQRPRPRWCKRDPGDGGLPRDALAWSSPRVLGEPAAQHAGYDRASHGALQRRPPAHGPAAPSPCRGGARHGRGPPMKTDVAVIGTGLSALAAARTIQQSGRQVVLVWPGLSSLYFLSATVDVLGYPTATAAEPIAHPAEAVARLIADEPTHPYARAGMNAVEASIGLMLEWFKEAGLAWEGALNRNFLLPTATGTPKPCCLAPASMTAGDLSRPEPIVFCGFIGYQDFAPELAASNLKGQIGRASVSAVRVTAPGYGPDRLFTSIDLARSFEDAAFRDAVAGQLRERVSGDGVRIGVPGVLGLTTPNETFAAFQRAVGHPVFEIPTVPPSVIPLRLFDRLRKHLQEAG